MTHTISLKNVDVALLEEQRKVLRNILCRKSTIILTPHEVDTTNAIDDLLSDLVDSSIEMNKKD